MNNKKVVMIGFVLLLLMSLPVSAQENLIDLSEIRAGVSPDNFFYFLDSIGDNIKLSLTRDKVKARLEIAHERLLEYQAMIEKGDSRAATIAENRRQKHFDVILLLEDSSDRVKDVLSKHVTVLEGLKVRFEANGNENALRGIINALEKSKNSFDVVDRNIGSDRPSATVATTGRSGGGGY